MEVPDRFPHVVCVRIIDNYGVMLERAKEIVAWCRERFGEGWDGTRYPNGVWTTQDGGPPAIRFVHEDDAFEFKMRWG